MAKIITTNHKVVKFLGFKVIDIWEDYLERRMLTDEDITITEYNNDEKESDN